MYREDLKMLDGIDSYYYDDSDNEEQEQDNHIDCDDLDDVEPDWQRALNDYEHSFERYN